jgi:CRP-like cAMP-binding protein
MNAFGQHAEEFEEKMLRPGNFVGDVDRLISTEDRFHTTTLVATTPGSVFYIQKNELQNFLFENPGILMSFTGKIFVQ